MFILRFLLISILGIAILGFTIFFAPLKQIQWGSLQLQPAPTVTVTGEASKQHSNELASFVAGVSTINDNKEQATQEVNTIVAQLIQAVKTFGISEADIKTQNLSVYRMEEEYYEEGRRKTRPGQWRISNDIEITLRDIEKASALATLLTAQGATNIYGPTFRLNNYQEVDAQLYEQALQDAKKRAEALAAASNRQLGEIIAISEDGTQGGVVPLMREMGGGGGGGMPIQPGSSTTYKNLTVVFEWK